MESLGTLPDPFLAEILAQPESMRRTADALASTAVLAPVGSQDRNAVVFTGMGASYHACYVPVTILAGGGRNATMVDAAELLHFRRPMLNVDTALVMVSQSGESAEVVGLLEAIDGPGRPFVVGVTNGPDSTLARAADVTIDVRAGRETGPSTMTFASTLVALSALAEVLAGASSGQATHEAARRAEGAASGAEAILARREELLARVDAWVQARSAVVTLGRGTGRAASETAALLLKEAAGLPVEALEAAQFRHGPLELAGPTLAAGMIATEEATARFDLALADDLRSAGASVLVITHHDGGRAVGGGTIRIPDVGRALAPALAVIPFQLLAWRLAVERGNTPGELRLASKVTTRE